MRNTCTLAASGGNRVRVLRGSPDAESVFFRCVVQSWQQQAVRTQQRVDALARAIQQTFDAVLRRAFAGWRRLAAMDRRSRLERQLEDAEDEIGRMRETMAQEIERGVVDGLRLHQKLEVDMSLSTPARVNRGPPEGEEGSSDLFSPVLPVQHAQQRRAVPAAVQTEGPPVTAALALQPRLEAAAREQVGLSDSPPLVPPLGPLSRLALSFSVNTSHPQEESPGGLLDRGRQQQGQASRSARRQPPDAQAVALPDEEDSVEEELRRQQAAVAAVLRRVPPPTRPQAPAWRQQRALPPPRCEWSKNATDCVVSLSHVRSNGRDPDSLSLAFRSWRTWAVSRRRIRLALRPGLQLDVSTTFRDDEPRVEHEPPAATAGGSTGRYAPVRGPRVVHTGPRADVSLRWAAPRLAGTDDPAAAAMASAAAAMRTSLTIAHRQRVAARRTPADEEEEEDSWGDIRLSHSHRPAPTRTSDTDEDGSPAEELSDSDLDLNLPMPPGPRLTSLLRTPRAAPAANRPKVQFENPVDSFLVSDLPRMSPHRYANHLPSRRPHVAYARLLQSVDRLEGGAVRTGLKNRPPCTRLPVAMSLPTFAGRIGGPGPSDLLGHPRPAQPCRACCDAASQPAAARG